MRTTVIITSKDNKANLSRSLVSLLESTQKPTNICMIFDESVDTNLWATAIGMLGGCCGAAPPKETVTDAGTTVTNVKYDINFLAVKLKGKKNLVAMKNYAIDQLSNQTDAFFTLSSGTAYGPNLLEKYCEKFTDKLVKFVYSDYYDSGKEVYLPAFHSMITAPIKMEEFAFKNEGVKFQNDEFSIVNQLYTTGIISHIPEFLFSK